MDANEIWADRFILSLRALGIALMVVVFGWILVSLAANLVEAIGKGVVATLLMGYVGGRLHAMWHERRLRRLKTIRSDEPPHVMRRPPVPLAASSVAAAKSEAEGVPGSENPSAKACFEREMATAKDEELRRAADLTAKQLQQAIELVQGKVGKERAESDGALVGAVLEVLATNYRLATR